MATDIEDFIDMPVLAYTLQYIGTLYHPSNLS